MAAEKDPCGGGGAGASRSAVSLDWRATLALGEHLSHPPRLPRKVFFTPPCPSSAPTLSPARVGLGPLVKKVTRSHQLLLPLGTGGVLETGAAKDPGGPPAFPPPQLERCVPGLQRGRGPAEGCPHQCVSACRSAAASSCFIPACSATASERGGGERESVCKVLLPGAQRRLLQLQLSFISPVNMRDHGRLRASQL